MPPPESSPNAISVIIGWRRVSPLLVWQPAPPGRLGIYPPVGREEAREEVYVSATDNPGFGDPAAARPGFWVADPGGAIRSRWFLELKALLGLQKGEPHEPA